MQEKIQIVMNLKGLNFISFWKLHFTGGPEKVEKNFPFSPISFPYGLAIWNFSEK
jgi:hypothetical protein